MILGTSKILTLFGPIIGHFWARRPCICCLSFTKILQTILESIWEHLGKYYFPMSDKHFFENIRKANPPCFFEFIFGSIFVSIFWIYIFKIILWRWGLENDSFSITKQHPILDLNFISINKHEQDFTLNFVFSSNVP